MVSFKLLVLLIVASIYVSSARSDDEILDVIKDTAKKIEAESTTEAKGFFSDFKDKVSSYYDTAVEKGKETFKSTADTISDQYNKLKEKAKEFIEKKAEEVSTEAPKTSK